MSDPSKLPEGGLLFQNLSVTFEGSVQAEWAVADTNDTGEVFAHIAYDPELKQAVQVVFDLLEDRARRAAMINCGSCTGACCTADGFSVIMWSKADIHRAAKFLEMSVEQFSSEFIISAGEGLGGKNIKHQAIHSEVKICPFLAVEPETKAGRCSIYEVRPHACRAFSSWNCDQWTPLPGIDLKTFIQPAWDVSPTDLDKLREGYAVREEADASSSEVSNSSTQQDNR